MYIIKYTNQHRQKEAMNREMAEWVIELKKVSV